MLRTLDFSQLSADQLRDLTATLMMMLATYAHLNQNLYDAFKSHSKDDSEALIEAWAEGVAKAEGTFDAALASVLLPTSAAKAN